MKQLLLAGAIAAALRTAASACPIDMDANATTTARDVHTRGHLSSGVTLIMEPPQTGAPHRDLQKTAASMTVRWNTAPAQSLTATTAASTRLAPALPPLAIF
ncbi:MAG: hypothetical protein JO165_13775 [Candidatus Eremiobacteraeota bacterium]|nr:hypothetical protein [Candidatus Eremiobacteraeota bacterium]